MMIDIAKIAQPPVVAIILFGSQARGDYDTKSDTDLAIFAALSGYRELSSLKHELTTLLPKDVEVALYSKKTILRMAHSGSLYLWHLRKEGKILFERSAFASQILSNLPPYSATKAYMDLSTFRIVLKDVLQTIAAGRETATFEAATIFSVVRNAGTILSAVNGLPIFGRVEPLRYLKGQMGTDFPFDEPTLHQLLQVRLSYSRGIGVEEEVRLPEIETAAASALKVLDYVERMVL
jgi:predicted nucleotidyltransferase